MNSRGHLLGQPLASADVEGAVQKSRKSGSVIRRFASMKAVVHFKVLHAWCGRLGFEVLECRIPRTSLR